MTAHSRLAASQTKRWMNCVGWPAVIEKFPHLKQPSGHAANMGTCAHAVVERCLGEGSEPEDYRGRLVQIVEDKDGNEDAKILSPKARMPADSSKTFEVDDDMIDATTCMTEYVRRRCVELVLVPEGMTPARGVVELVERGIVRLEKRVNPLPDRDDTGGTGDVIIDAWPVVLEIVDYKNGSGVYVPVQKNHQLRSYGLGSLMLDGELGYEQVRYTICQPRHRDAPRDGISYEECEVVDLMTYQQDMADACLRVDEGRALLERDDAPDDIDGCMTALDEAGLLSVGEDGSHCDYCEVADRCPAAKRRIQELACMDFDDEPDGSLEAATSTNHLAIVAPWIPFIEKWCRQTFGNIERLLMAGHGVDGMKVVRKKSTGRKFKAELVLNEGEDDEQRIELTDANIRKIVAERFEVDPDDMVTEPSLKSGPQIEKLIKGKQKKAEFSSLLLFMPEGGLTVAPESDPRPAVDMNPADDFDDDLE